MAKEEKQLVKEVNAPGKPLPAGKIDTPAPPAGDGLELRCGFIIGVSTKGELKFNLIGDNPSIAELSGLVEIARNYIDNIIDDKLNGGMTLILQRLENIQKELHKLGAYQDTTDE